MNGFMPFTALHQPPITHLDTAINLKYWLGLGLCFVLKLTLKT